MTTIPVGATEFTVVFLLTTIINQLTMNIFIGFLGTSSSNSNYFALNAVYRMTGGSNLNIPANQLALALGPVLPYTAPVIYIK